MGFIDDKENINKEISLFKVINDLPRGEKQTSSIESIRTGTKKYFTLSN